MAIAAANKKHYGAIDGLRAFSCLGIVLMHIRANTDYEISGFIYNELIASFTDLVFLFMIISAFGMCYGYYDKIVNNKITIGEFYGKRYTKIWPFFAILCLFELSLSPGLNTLYESFANLTLCYGLLPNAKISVIGVGWFLGLVFVFYLIFPFFCWLLQSKRRAWFSFALALIFNLSCEQYFFNSEHVIEGYSARTNIIYCFVFFVAGGLIFLYREQLERFADKYRWLVAAACVPAATGYYVLGRSVIIMLLLYSLLLIYTLYSAKAGKVRHIAILNNSLTKFLGSLSMEIYLCHMVIFRVIEKLELIHLLESDILCYLLVAGGTIAGSVLLSLLLNRFTDRCIIIVLQIKVKIYNKILLAKSGSQ